MTDKITSDAQAIMAIGSLTGEYGCSLLAACDIAQLRAVLGYLAIRLSAPPAGCDPTVRFNDDGSLDEVVGAGTFHLEQMDTGHWWMQLGPHMVGLHARGKITAHFGKNEAASPAAADGAVGS